MKTLIIDPGHGGSDSGASAHGIREKDWNLEISLYQYQRLKDLGAKVALTRSKDVTLPSQPRSQLIKGKYDLCISNHWNAFNGKARGVETIHSIFSTSVLANKLAKAICQATGLPFRRVFSKGNGRGSDYYFMHRLTGSTQTVIIEYGFLDHAGDFAFYKTKANRILAAEAVIQVLCKELGVTYRPPEEGTPLYRVQTGAFQKRDNAKALLDQVKKAGFDGFITEGRQ